MTHPHEQVVRDVNAHFVACRLESAKNVELARRMSVRWLPGIVVADAEERPAHVSIGFLPPDDLVTELTYGRAVAAMGAKRYDEAHELYQTVAESPNADRAPEAYFWWGISRYRQTKDFQGAVKEPWSKILARWPDSQWAKKVGYALGSPARID